MVIIVSQENPSYLGYKQLKNRPKHVITVERNVPMTNTVTMETLYANIYRMADTGTGEYAGKMIARPIPNLVCDEVYPQVKKCNTFKVEDLHVENKGNGYGTAFMQLAEIESTKTGCEGRVFLNASRIFAPRNPPHLFYRKLGYTSVNEKVNKAIDRCIKNGSKLDYTLANDLLMYRPIKEVQPQHQVSRLSIFLKNLVKYII